MIMKKLIGSRYVLKHFDGEADILICNSYFSKE